MTQFPFVFQVGSVPLFFLLFDSWESFNLMEILFGQSDCLKCNEQKRTMDRTLCVLSSSSSSSWTYNRGRSNYNTSTGSEAQYFPPHRKRNSLFFCSTKICDSSTSTSQLRTAAASSEVPNSFLSSKGGFRVRLQRRKRRIRRKNLSSLLILLCQLLQLPLLLRTHQQTFPSSSQVFPDFIERTLPPV